MGGPAPSSISIRVGSIQLTLSLDANFHAGKSSLFVGCKKVYLLYRPAEGGTLAWPAPMEIAVPGPSTTPSIGTVWMGSAGQQQMGSGGSSASARGSNASLSTVDSSAVGGSGLVPPLRVGGGGASSTTAADSELSVPATAAVEVLLACGNSVVFFGEDGKPIKK